MRDREIERDNDRENKRGRAPILKQDPRAVSESLSLVAPRNIADITRLRVAPKNSSDITPDGKSPFSDVCWIPWPEHTTSVPFLSPREFGSGAPQRDRVGIWIPG